MSRKYEERKPGWWHFPPIDAFGGDECALHKETGWLYFKSGAKYSPQELGLLDADNLLTGGKLDAQTHRIKRIIGGEIVDIIDTTGRKKSAVKIPDMYLY